MRYNKKPKKNSLVFSCIEKSKIVEINKKRKYKIEKVGISECAYLLRH